MWVLGPGRVECVNVAQETIKLNFNPKVLRNDLWDYSPADWPDCDLFHAGFPCQDFSPIGRNLGTKNPSGRGKIFLQILAHIKAKRPATVLLENVKGLVPARHSAVLKQILDELASLGYRCYWKVIDAADCGLPQHRERVFIIAIRRDRDCCTGPFEWPEKLSPTPLTSILDKRTTSENQ